MADISETQTEAPKFDFSAYPPDTLFLDRRTGLDRRGGPSEPDPAPATAERRVKKERRRRIDPTTFEKQYTEDELEFMNAVQRFKTQSGKTFPTHGDILRIASALGYRKSYPIDDLETDVAFVTEPGDH